MPQELQRRTIPLTLPDTVLQRPLASGSERIDRVADQSPLDFGDGRIFLLRAIVDQTVDPPVVVTVYRTSKIGKYRRTP